MRGFHRGMNEEERDHCYRGYLACVSFMDEQLGRVLEALKQSGLAANTLISFVADHGYHIGEQARWDKMMLLDPSLHVSLILSGLGIASGQTSEGIVESLDLFPTLLEQYGLGKAQDSDAQLLVNASKEPVSDPHRDAYSWSIQEAVTAGQFAPPATAMG